MRLKRKPSNGHWIHRDEYWTMWIKRFARPKTHTNCRRYKNVWTNRATKRKPTTNSRYATPNHRMSKLNYSILFFRTHTHTEFGLDTPQTHLRWPIDNEEKSKCSIAWPSVWNYDGSADKAGKTTAHPQTLDSDDLIFCPFIDGFFLRLQDDKYILKYQSSPGLGSGESRSIEGRFNPITKINLIFVRQSAVEKNTFFLINTNVSQMLELTAPSGSECKTYVTIKRLTFEINLQLMNWVYRYLIRTRARVFQSMTMADVNVKTIMLASDILLSILFLGRMSINRIRFTSHWYAVQSLRNRNMFQFC